MNNDNFLKLPKKIQDSMGNKLFAYAYFDLQGTGMWTCLDEENISFWSGTETSWQQVHQLPLQSLIKCEVVESFSVNTLFLRFEDQQKGLLFSRKMKTSVGNLSALLKRWIDKGSFPAGLNFEEIFQKSFKEKDLIEGRQNEVKKETLWRLLAYLKPYKKEFFWGAIAAVGMTIVSLIPPYLGSVLVDDVVRPYQSKDSSFHEAQKIFYSANLPSRSELFVKRVFCLYSLEKHVRHW